MTNYVVLYGRLARDGKSGKSKQGDIPYYQNALAVRTPTKSDKDRVQFFNFSAFGKSAEILTNMCKKGDRVVLSGHLGINEHAVESLKKPLTELQISVDEVTIVETKSEVSRASTSAVDADVLETF